MALSQTPPALFRQGLSARLRLLIAVAASIALMQADLSMALLKPLRQGLSVVLYPLEQALLIPRDVLGWISGHGQIIFDISSREEGLKRREAEQADRLLQAERLLTENAELRALLDLRKSIRPKTLTAEVSHYTKDPFSNRIVLNRGSQHGVVPGHPVLSAQGLIGQIVHVSPISSEVALITDPQLTIPVSLPSSGIRSLLTGSGDGQQARLRYLNANARAEVGELILTSGLDGLYPAGLPVARITRIDLAKDGGFSRVMAKPVAEIATGQGVMVILVDPSVIPPAPRLLNEMKNPQGKSQ